MIYGLLIILIILLIVIFIQRNKIQYFNLVSKNLSAMKVIQNMYDIMGTDLDAKSKAEKLNKSIIGTYDIKYSSIIIYDGNEYRVYSSNVDREYYNGIMEIVKENNIKGNVKRNVSKYITTSSNKTLTYKSAIERNIKSCMFIPIYNKNVYLGFLLLEDELENAFDSISKAEISKFKNNLGIFLQNIISQDVIEKCENKDKLTDVYNNIYLYTNVRRNVLKYENTSIMLIDFSNIESINKLYTRDIANKLLIKSVESLKKLIASDTEVIRYSGTKFLLIMYNTTAENFHSVAERILNRLKSSIGEKVEDKYVNLDIKMVLSTVKKQSNIEVEIQKMVNYINKFKESDTIKII